MTADETNEAEPTIPDPLIIDLTPVQSTEELHRLLQRELVFPDFYGRNWNAFWDAITGLVDMPHHLTFTGWATFSAALPTEAEKLRELLDEYQDEYAPSFTAPCHIHYQ